MSRVLLDINQIVTTRTDLKLTQRELANRIGVNPITVGRIERGLNHEALDLSTLSRLAAALGLAITSLFPENQQHGSRDQDTSADARRLEALLLEAKTAVRSDEIAETLHWTLPRTQRALAELSEGLAGRGAVLAGTLGLHLIRARIDLLTAAERKRLERARHARLGLRLHEARLLQRALTNTLRDDWQSKASASDRHAMAALLKAGLVEVKANRLQLTKEASFSLSPGV